ncbi:response regulator [Blastomonas sp. CCH3-E3]|uniref:response regulator n=1 Tax=Blastomonas sp. CCH3-E3 TaxID=1768742 RepID=UPI0012E39F8E|nr:response regulator [Blastomonas sp. CCH3-E3]
MTSPPSDEALLRGCRVLVVEDDFLIADDFSRRLVAHGAQIVGPAATLDAALQALDQAGSVDVAVLDINLRGTLVWSRPSMRCNLGCGHRAAWSGGLGCNL